MQLIFPLGDNRSGRMLEKAIDEQDLDYRLTGPYQISGPNEEDAGSSLLPIYVHELFNVCPHWGDRLYSILQEVVEPTPMSWLGLSNKECFCSTDRTRSVKQTARVVLALCTLDGP